MRNEVEKVISELRGAAAEQQLGQLAQLFDAYADDLQAILDTDYVAKDSQLGCSCLCHEQDPVARLEAMGATFIVQTPTGILDDEGSEIVTVKVGFWNKERGLAPSEPLGKGNLSEAYRDAATRLLARIEKEESK